MSSSVSQCGDGNREYIQSVEEVISEAGFPDFHLRSDWLPQLF